MISSPMEGYFEIFPAGRAYTREAFRDFSQAFRALMRLGYAAGTTDKFITFRNSKIRPVWTDVH